MGKFTMLLVCGLLLLALVPPVYGAPSDEDWGLQELTVENATLTPAFDTNVTEYSVGEVAYSVSSLELVALPTEENATASISGNELAVGENTVHITVIANNGDTKVYSIQVTRRPDSGYVANTDLANITVEGFVISPPFQAEVDRYEVWLPYEVESINVTATPVDSKSTIWIEGGTDLIAGADNTVTVICTAETGEEKAYYIIAKRAADPNGKKPTPPEDSTNPVETEPIPTQPEEVTNGVGIGTMVTMCLIFMLLGGLMVLFVTKPSVRNKDFLGEEDR